MSVDHKPDLETIEAATGVAMKAISDYAASIGACPSCTVTRVILQGVYMTATKIQTDADLEALVDSVRDALIAGYRDSHARDGGEDFGTSELPADSFIVATDARLH
jgi:hypothetical protein